MNSNFEYGLVFLKFLLIPLLLSKLGSLQENKKYFLHGIIMIILICSLVYGFRGTDRLGYGINSIYLGAILSIGLYDILDERKYLFSIVIFGAIILNGSGTSLVMLMTVLLLRGGFKSMLIVLLLIPTITFVIENRGRSINAIQDWDRIILTSTYLQSLFNANPLMLFFSGLGQYGLDAWSIYLKSSVIYDYVLAENGVIRENMLHNDFLRLINSFGLFWTLYYWLTLYRTLGKKVFVLLAGSLVNPLLTVNVFIFSLLFFNKR